MERIAESLDQFGFAESGHSLEQDVAFAKNGHQDIVDEIGIPDDNLRNLVVHTPKVRLKRIYLTLKIGYRVAHWTKVIAFSGTQASRNYGDRDRILKFKNSVSVPIIPFIKCKLES